MPKISIENERYGLLTRGGDLFRIDRKSGDVWILSEKEVRWYLIPEPKESKSE